MVQLALDAAREAGLAVGQFGDQRDNQIALIDHLEVTGVNLSHDVAADLRNFGRFQRDRAFRRLHFHRRGTFLQRFDRCRVQDKFVDIARIERDEMFRQHRAKRIDLLQRIRQIHHVTHRE